jgi:hypothetical protein
VSHPFVWRDSQDLLLLEEEDEDEDEDEEKEMISESSVHEYFSSWTTLAVTLAVLQEQYGKADMTTYQPLHCPTVALDW